MKNQKVQLDNRYKRGFTLVELLVVIIIMTILTGIGVGVFSGASQRLQVQRAASTLLMMAQYARMSAIENQRVYKLYLDNANNEFYLLTTLFDEQNGTAEEILIEDNIVSPVYLEEPITIEDVRILSNDYNSGSSSSNQYIIAFTPDGTSQTSAVQIGDQQSHYTLSVNEVTGKSKLIEGTIDDVKVDTIDIDAENF
ncbi:MAG: prepilin-type N-terminal cleavage/methylation domain-containing protein [Sedimentisphaerales bacterium]|nr:prepilin-type N-terminal cleavage/methylation domain-containing protein [Sedimentisphaerales bacterium]